MSNAEFFEQQRARIEALEQENGRLREQRAQFQADWSKAEAMLDELKIRLAAVGQEHAALKARYDLIGDAAAFQFIIDERDDSKRRLATIENCASQTGEQLPCRVDEMTPREHEIFKVGAAYAGKLNAIRDWADLSRALTPEAAQDENQKPTTTNWGAPTCCWRMHGPRLICGCECHRAAQEGVQETDEAYLKAAGWHLLSGTGNVWEDYIEPYGFQPTDEAVAIQRSRDAEKGEK